MEIDFPRGPWQRVFEGEWSGTRVHLFKNPDRYTLTTVEDREAGELKGLVLFLNKYFIVSGNVSRLNTELGGYSILLEENFPARKGRFFAISTGPEYTEPKTKEVDEKVEELFHVIKDKQKKLYELSKSHEVDLTELKNASQEEEELLFNRPSLLPALLMSREEKQERRVGKKVLLGKKLDGTKAEETIDKFRSTAVIGDRDRRRKAIQVLLENCVLSGVNGVILDDFNEHTGLASPNPRFPHDEYPEVQPIGLPLRTLKPGKIQIDLNLLDKKSFREIIHVPDEDEEYQGKKAAEMIDNIIESEYELNGLKDIEEKLMIMKEDVKKFHKYRGVRWMKVINQEYPDFMDGKMDLKSMVSTYLQSMGSIIRIDTSALPSNMKRAFAYSFLQTLYGENKEEGFKKGLRAIIILPNSKVYTPSNPTTRLHEKILEVLTDANAYGVGYALGAEDKVDIYPPLLEEATLTQEFVEEDEVAVKPDEGKPYRVKLRPFLTE